MATVFTLVGIVTDVSDVHVKKASEATFVTVFGMVKLVNELQFKNA